MPEVTLLAYRWDDVPAVLAAAGLLRVLQRSAGIAARLSWRVTDAVPHAVLHLPDGFGETDLVGGLRRAAEARAESPIWGMLDAGLKPDTWRAAHEAALASGREACDFLAASGCYGKWPDGEWRGGRSPLICTARNQTPGKWGRKAAERAALASEADWAAHFRLWGQDFGTWQGWRRADCREGGDAAAVWLGLEGLSLFPCSFAPQYDEDGTTGFSTQAVVCPGWNPSTETFRYPLPETPVGLDVLASLVANPLRCRHVRFARLSIQTAQYRLREFQQGVGGLPAISSAP